MANVYKWSNVAVAMQSALGATKSIGAGGITKANPGVVTSTAHGFANGDYVLLFVTGMYQVDGRVFRVAGQTANTFQLEGEDTTLYDTVVSGTAQLITYGTNASTLTGLSASGGNFDFIDVTTIHSNARQQIPGLPQPVNYEFTSIWDPADSALAAMKVASDNQAQRAFRFSFGTSGPKIVFNGYVGATLLPGGQAQDKVETQVVITMFGRPTVYSS